MKKLLLVCVVVCFTLAAFGADEDQGKPRTTVRLWTGFRPRPPCWMKSSPRRTHGIPEEVLGSAECVAVVPSMLKGGFIVGARYGRGVASCRTPKGWSAPAFFTIAGGSFGLQIGGQAVDLVMLIMNRQRHEESAFQRIQAGR